MQAQVFASSDSLLQHRPFVFFWFARVAATVAYQMQVVAVGWQIYDLTRRPLDLGLVGLAQFLPSIVLVLVVGHVADRYDRRRILQIGLTVLALAAASLALGSAQGWITETAIFAIVVVVGAALAFHQPTMQALLPGLVPRPLLARALASSASASQTAIIIGPALGGFIYIAGPAVVYASSTALFIVACLLLSLIRIERKPRMPASPSLASVFAGFAFIRSRPLVLGAISLDLFAVLLGGAAALFPIYARDILATGPWGLGLLRSATAVGALTLAIFLAHRPLPNHVGRIMFAAVAVFGLATIVFGLSRSFGLSLAALAVLGASDMVSVVIRSSLVQISTPDEMRGRVSAVNSIFIGTSNQLGEFESGLTAAWFGVVPSVVIGGIGTLLVALTCIRAFPDLYRVDRLDNVKTS